MPEKIGLRAFRRDMTRVFERVAAGERFVITDRGKAVAILEPLIFASTPEVRAP